MDYNASVENFSVIEKFSYLCAFQRGGRYARCLVIFHEEVTQMRIVIATKNKGKLKEINEIFRDTNVDIVSMEEIGIDIEVDEDGTTFSENALKKANEIMKMSGEVTLADDSGLEVDYLGGAPGIYSARYAGEGATDADRNQKLLGELKGVPIEKRSARFVCAIACVFQNGEKIEAMGSCEGLIAFEPKGDKGFGYDPLLYLEEYGLTMAELGSEIKNSISHRAKALADFKQKFTEYINMQS